MPSEEFASVYAIARRAAAVRSAGAVSRGVVSADREDLQQEALLAVWKALPRHDPSRASLRTFVEIVVATRMASLLRSRRRQPQCEPLNSCQRSSSGRELYLRIDIERALGKLPQKDRRLAETLSEHSPSQTSRKLSMARSSVYEGIGRIRQALALAGLDQSRR